jgi:serine/threonine protein kinase/tetratricopeptide (TPR) repeat protein
MTTVFQRVAHFEILEELGRGGMATVFLAKDSRQDRDVALKLVPKQDDREHREILEAERSGAQLQARFSAICNLVPQVYEDGDAGRYYFIAMEYVAGENLSDVISRGPMSQVDASAVAAQLCSFLEEAHRFEASIDGRAFRSLVHGDLKPRNVRMATSGGLKVLDFGIAKALSLSRRVTRNDFGSMPYLSPERLDSVEVNPHADLWALGVILYEMLSGMAPFQARDTRRLEQSIRDGYARRPLNGGCPRSMQAIVARLLAPEMDHRYPTATAVREDLERAGLGQTTDAEREGWPARADDSPTMKTVRPTAAATSLPSSDVEEATHRTTAEDEATRRTTAEDEATRRRSPGEQTTRPAAPSSAAAAAPAAVPMPVARTRSVPPWPLPLPSQVPAAPPVPSPAGQTPLAQARASVVARFRRTPLRSVLLLAALLLVVNEVAIAWSADRVAATVGSRDLDSLSDGYSSYDRLSQRSFLRVGLINLGRTLRRRTVSLSDQVIANYRSTTPTVRERQWASARTNLLLASALAPGDSRIKSALRYCEGHLHRINGEAMRRRGQATSATQEFTAAVTAFQEAAELRGDWPDPYLGRARTFIYGLDDIDRAVEALREAQQRGYKTGDREIAQLADGYRTRGDSLAKTALQLRDLPQEPEYLRRAIEAYHEAQKLCEQIPALPGVAGQLRRMKYAIEQIQERLADLEALTEASGEPEKWE